jgi:spore germination cell wall hydrolase CwlJ-like protein
MFWPRLTGTVRALWTGIVDEIEKNPQALKQGAVAAVAFAAAAAAMPAMAERGAEQRADAEWTARALSFQKSMAESQLAQATQTSVQPAARLQLASVPTEFGWRARAEGALARDAMDGRAMIVSAALRDSASLAALHPFQPASLRAAQDTTRESKCLAEAVYYEARGESLEGQMAVAEVVVNRTRSGIYPSTNCGVIYQGADRSTGCQFTFTCDGSLGRQPRGASWQQSEMIAAQVMMGIARPITHHATHYHTIEVAPVWSASLVQTTRIGSHIFYRFKTRSEKQAAQQIADASAQHDASPVV